MLALAMGAIIIIFQMKTNSMALDTICVFVQHYDYTEI